MKLFFLRMVILGLLLWSGVGQAKAGLILYADRPSFNAATSGLTTIDFEGIAPENGFMFEPTPPGVTLSGVNFTIDPTNNNGNLFVIGKGFYYAGNSVLSSQGSAPGTNNLVITLPGPSTAIGLDLGSFFGATVTFTLSSGDTFTETPASFPNLNFVGFTSTNPAVLLRLDQPPGDVLNIDNFSFGSAASPNSVPEPCTFTLLTIGLAAISGCAGRARLRAQCSI